MLKFKNIESKKDGDILFKEFSHNGVTITRYDFESMPCPMFAKELSDDVMQKITKETYEWLISIGWENAQVSKYLEDRTKSLEGMKTEEQIEADAIESDFWKFVEKAAIENGMRYYEDIKEE